MMNKVILISALLICRVFCHELTTLDQALTDSHAIVVDGVITAVKSNVIDTVSEGDKEQSHVVIKYEFKIEEVLKGSLKAGERLELRYQDILLGNANAKYNVGDTFRYFMAPGKTVGEKFIPHGDDIITRIKLKDKGLILSVNEHTTRPHLYGKPLYPEEPSAVVEHGAPHDHDIPRTDNATQPAPAAEKKFPWWVMILLGIVAVVLVALRLLRRS